MIESYSLQFVSQWPFLQVNKRNVQPSLSCDTLACSSTLIWTHRKQDIAWTEKINVKKSDLECLFTEQSHLDLVETKNMGCCLNFMPQTIQYDVFQTLSI